MLSERIAVLTKSEATKQETTSKKQQVSAKGDSTYRSQKGAVLLLNIFSSLQILHF